MVVLYINLLLLNCLVLTKRYKWVTELLIFLWKKIKPFLTWRILIIYIPIWFVISGWSMVGIAIGHSWFRTVSISWQAFLWMPFCPEKLVTIPLTIYLHKKIFPNHSTSNLENVLENEKSKARSQRSKLKR